MGNKMYALNCQVYFVQVVGGGPIKIGCAGHAESRVTALQNYCPYKIELLGHIPGNEAHERWLHSLLSSERLRGEWFHSTLITRSVVKAVLDSCFEWPDPLPKKFNVRRLFMRGQSLPGGSIGNDMVELPAQ